MDLVRQASLEKVRSGSRSLVKAGPHYGGDTDLNVSGLLRDDKHFPFAINIPLPQTTARAASRPQRRPQSGCDLLLPLTLLRDAARGDAR